MYLNKRNDSASQTECSYIYIYIYSFFSVLAVVWCLFIRCRSTFYRLWHMCECEYICINVSYLIEWVFLYWKRLARLFLSHIKIVRINFSTYIFSRTFPLGNELGNMVLILFRLRSNCVSCEIANNASVLINCMSLLDKINVFNAYKPTKMGIFVNWLCFKLNFSKLVRFPILCSQRSLPKLLCDSSLFSVGSKWREKKIYLLLLIT